MSAPAFPLNIAPRHELLGMEVPFLEDSLFAIFSLCFALTVVVALSKDASNQAPRTPVDIGARLPFRHGTPRHGSRRKETLAKPRWASGCSAILREVQKAACSCRDATSLVASNQSAIIADFAFEALDVLGRDRAAHKANPPLPACVSASSRLTAR
jgi:hypothetical protein